MTTRQAERIQRGFGLLVDRGDDYGVGSDGPQTQCAPAASPDVRFVTDLLAEGRLGRLESALLVADGDSAANGSQETLIDGP
ncbi:hypothetical protein [Streptomyces sp. NRRL S-1448]|uniref:hypothetical protein n=1 Tax=Streptomyces sp. NRRL S-1448 TaxID=1463883 RepID=UPI0004C1B78D|nr:hypothetical protein [Streptomyces sp. NRRL S-1448]